MDIPVYRDRGQAASVQDIHQSIHAMVHQHERKRPKKRPVVTFQSQRNEVDRPLY